MSLCSWKKVFPLILPDVYKLTSCYWADIIELWNCVFVFLKKIKYINECIKNLVQLCVCRNPQFFPMTCWAAFRRERYFPTYTSLLWKRNNNVEFYPTFSGPLFRLSLRPCPFGDTSPGSYMSLPRMRRGAAHTRRGRDRKKIAGSHKVQSLAG